MRVQIALTTSLLFALPFTVLAAPGIPEQFYGAVAYSSGTTPAGVVVIASIGGTAIASSTTGNNGEYGLSPSLLIVPDANGDLSGTVVTFTVNGVPATPTAVFSNALLTRLDLSVTGAAPGSNTVSASSGGGGGGGSSQPSATEENIPAASAGKSDLNGDGKVNLLDFNSLMVHWGQSGSAATDDLNGDKVVDFLDFNVLMVNWTSI